MENEEQNIHPNQKRYEIKRWMDEHSHRVQHTFKSLNKQNNALDEDIIDYSYILYIGTLII